MSKIKSENILTKKELIILKRSINRKSHTSGLGKISIDIIKKALLTYKFTNKDSWLLASVPENIFHLIFDNKNIKSSLILQAALRGYHTDSIKRFVKKKLTDDDVISVLEWAVEEGEIDIVQYLINKYKINILRDANREGRNVIDLATIHHPNILPLLLRDLPQIEINSNLDLAIGTNDIKVTEIILKHSKAVISQETFIRVYNSKYYEMVKLLSYHVSISKSTHPNLEILAIIILLSYKSTKYYDNIVV